MLTIHWKQIYEFNLNDNKQWILILYDISQNHYVGVPVYNEEKENSVYLKSPPDTGTASLRWRTKYQGPRSPVPFRQALAQVLCFPPTFSANHPEFPFLRI